MEIVRGLTLNQVVGARRDAFRRAQENIEARRKDPGDPLFRKSASDPGVRLATRHEFKRIMEQFFIPGAGQEPGAEAQFANMTTDQLLDLAANGPPDQPERAADLLVQRGELPQ